MAQIRYQRYLLAYSVILFSVFMGIILGYMALKNYSFADELVLHGESGQSENGKKLTVLWTDSGNIIVPLPRQVGERGYFVDPIYSEHIVDIYFDGDYEEFFSENLVMAGEEVSGVWLQSGGAVTRLRLEFGEDTDIIFEQKNGGLYIRMAEPTVLYEKRILIDVSNISSDDYEDTLLLISERVKNLLMRKGIRAYLTREGTGKSADAEKLLQQIQPQLFLRLCLSEAESPEGIKAVYNGRYFMLGFGNVEFSDSIERGAAQGGGTVLGIEPAPLSDELLYRLEIPACEISLGNIMSERDNTRLQDEDRREDIAKGIASAIEISFSKIKGVNK